MGIITILLTAAWIISVATCAWACNKIREAKDNAYSEYRYRCWKAAKDAVVEVALEKWYTDRSAA